MHDCKLDLNEQFMYHERLLPVNAVQFKAVSFLALMIILQSLEKGCVITNRTCLWLMSFFWFRLQLATKTAIETPRIRRKVHLLHVSSDVRF